MGKVTSLMPMPAQDRENLQSNLDLLEAVAKVDTEESQWYHKALVDGAYQHLSHKDVGSALFLLGRVPSVYYTETIKIHMENDSSYAEQVVDIARILVNNNLVHLGLTETEQKSIQRV